MAILFLEASRIVVPVRCFVQFSLLKEPAPIKMCPCYCLKYIWPLLCCHDFRTCHLGIVQIKGDYRKTSKVSQLETKPPRSFFMMISWPPNRIFNFQNLLFSYQLHYIVFNTVGYIISGLCRLAIKPDHIHLSDVSEWWKDGNDLWCWTACSSDVWRKSFAQMGLCFTSQEVGVVGCRWIH